MTPRQNALKEMLSRSSSKTSSNCPIEAISDGFGKYVFNPSVMQKCLPKDIFQNVKKAMDGIEAILPEYANTLAVAMKEWALSLGATHYCHWFQPLNGLCAEKHDAFIDWDVPSEMVDVIEKFSGKELIQGEPDASSFPSGGLRSTYEARGYTGWDPTSLPFVWKRGNIVTLCLPSVFFSWTGAVLDTKLPLLRSDQKINEATIRLLKLVNVPATHVFSTLGLEQEYFVIDRAYRNLRPDLIMGGRTVYGAAPSKGQELQDHYFGIVKDRILCYMSEFEQEAYHLGIPLKTRHNEVAPAQHEVAPVYEKASRAVDHNILLMELMRKVAAEHDLSCLLHEKPFAGINGSGKHMNWSLSTDTGYNLLDPTDTPGSNLSFIILLTAILQGVYRHSTLLRASIGSASNDFRLGGHEAPPAIISVYLGRELEQVLEEIEKTGFHDGKNKKDSYALGLHLPDLKKDTTDRNRTSPFAFTGNKFEFRALGSSASPAFSATVLNLIVAESLTELVGEIEKGMKKGGSLLEAAIPVIKKSIALSKPIRFAGDNYSLAWVEEAEKRGLPNIHKSPDAFKAIQTKLTATLFEGVLTKEELSSRYDILVETYAQVQNIEVNLMIDLFKTQIFPAAVKSQKNLADAIASYEAVIGKDKSIEIQKNELKKIASLIAEASALTMKLEKERDIATSLKGDKIAFKFAESVLDIADALRQKVDALELLIEDNLWPLPKYREILFNI